MIVNFAERAHNHNWNLDPITRSLLDNDFYKFLMLQFIWRNFPETETVFSLINRSSSIRLGDVIGIEELLQQLEHVRRLSFRKSELVWLAGNTFYGVRGIFDPAFLEWLENGFRLSDYEVSAENGQFNLSFRGRWSATTMWEVHALSILSELKTRACLRDTGELALDILYARAKAKLWGKIERLRGTPALKVADFGTRRRHSFLWQEYVVKAMRDTLGSAFVGTSNTYLAFKHDLEAIGTNAHELPMALAAMAPDDAALQASQYKVLELWQRTYQGALLVMLPDTYGTTQFLEGAPQWMADWTGVRIDSKDPYAAGDEYIHWLGRRGRDPRQKLIIASDALEVDDILSLHAYFSGEIREGFTPQDFHSASDFLEGNKWAAQGRIRFSSGWGTLLTNDFRGCNPDGKDGFDPVNLVCKLSEVNARPTIKLSDNYAKAIGPDAELARYRRVFGSADIVNLPRGY